MRSKELERAVQETVRIMSNMSGGVHQAPASGGGIEIMLWESATLAVWRS